MKELNWKIQIWVHFHFETLLLYKIEVIVKKQLTQ